MRSPRRLPALLAAILSVAPLVLASGCAAVTSSQAGSATREAAVVDRLLVAMRQRLDVAPEVARVKWNSKGPIEDRAREKQIVDGVASAAPDHALDPTLAAAFFQAQIDASKQVQRGLHAEWAARGQPPFEKVPDLARDVRPVLDRLTPELLRALAEAIPILSRPGGRDLLSARVTVTLADAPGGVEAVRTAVAPLVALAR